MKKYLLFILIMFCEVLQADPILNEDIVKSITEEFKQAIKDKDFSVYQKYIYPGSKIIVDMDPDINKGKKEIGYDDFMKLTKMSLDLMKDAQFHVETISIKVDSTKNQATIEGKTTTVVNMMGMRMEDITINKTTYGVVDGKIRVIYSEDQLISSKTNQQKEAMGENN